MSAHEKLTLKDFEAILNEEKRKIQQNIDHIHTEILSIGYDDDIGDIEDMAELEIENATDQLLVQQLEGQIAEIDAALWRISQGTYGICEKTGKSIPIERLKANPTARTIVGE